MVGWNLIADTDTTCFSSMVPQLPPSPRTVSFRRHHLLQQRGVRRRCTLWELQLVDRSSEGDAKVIQNRA